MNEKQIKSDKELSILSHELKLIRALAGNNKVARDRALKSLRKWFHYRSRNLAFNEDDLMRVWKGLFYTMWMSDKPLVQEECAENICGLIHEMVSLDNALLFLKCGFLTLGNEWCGIDQLRLNKFLMLVRRFLRQGLVLLQQHDWQKSTLTDFGVVLRDSVLRTDSNYALGYQMHFLECFPEELAKIGGDHLKPNVVVELLHPFIDFLICCTDSRLMDHTRKHIFLYIIQQSDVGLEFTDRYKAWQKSGFRGSINDFVRIEVPSAADEQNTCVTKNTINGTLNGVNKVLDPRAGRVDVILPQIPVSSKLILKELLRYKFDSRATSRSRKVLNDIINRFQCLSQKQYPFVNKRLRLNHFEAPRIRGGNTVRKAANQLLKYDQKLKKYSNPRTNKRRPRRKLTTTDAVTSLINSMDQASEHKPQLRSSSGQWKVTHTFDSHNDTNSKTNGKLFPTYEFDITELTNGTTNSEKPKKAKTKQLQMSMAKMAAHPLINETSKPGNSIQSLKDNIRTAVKNAHNNGAKCKNVCQTNKLLKKALKRQQMDLQQRRAKKRVSINIRLNSSQELDDHVKQIMLSPAIPYDANKQPVRPLLKKTATSTLYRHSFNKS